MWTWERSFVCVCDSLSINHGDKWHILSSDGYRKNYKLERADRGLSLFILDTNKNDIICHVIIINFLKKYNILVKSQGMHLSIRVSDKYESWVKKTGPGEILLFIKLNELVGLTDILTSGQ